MSEKFDVPREHSRILSSPYTPSQPWTKIIIAFAAGLACAMLVITATFVWPRGNSDSAKVTAESSRVALAKKATTPAPKATDEPAPRDEAQPADASGSPDAANATPSEATAQDDPCAREAWPYVSQKCAGKQRTRNVRVITTDRTAPSTIVTAVPETSPRDTDPAPRTTDGAAPSAASVALAPSQAAPVESAPSAATPNAPAPAQETAAPNIVPTAAASEVPMPKAKPDAIARTEPETTGSAPAVEAEHQAPVAAAPVQESKSSRKSRERRDRHDARSNSRRDTARANPERQDNVGRDDTRFVGDEPRDSRASRSRSAQEQATRSTRSRTIQVNDDDDAAPTTRSVRTRDERRNARDARDDGRDARGDRRDERRTVTERAAEPERVDRSYAREDKPRLPFPFFFLGGNND